MFHSTPHFISEPRRTPLEDRLKTQLERFMAATRRRVLYRLDLGHPEHHAFARDMLLLSGDSPERSPRAFALLDEAHRAGGGRGGVYARDDDGGAAALTPVLKTMEADEQGQFPPGDIDPYNVLARFDVTGTSNYSANAVSTIPGGTNRTSIVLAFVNTTNNTILDTTTQSTTTYAQGEYFAVPLSGTLSGVTSEQVVSNATFYVYTSASPFPNVYYMSADAALPATDGCQTAPIYWENQGTSSCANNITNTDAIIACWYRGCQGGPGHTGCDCDYWNSVGHPTDFTFPVSGSLTFPAAPYTDNNGNLQGAFTLFLQVPTGGAYVMANGTPMTGAISGFQVQGNTVTWNFPAAAFPNDGTIQPNGAPVNFGLQLEILLTNGSNGSGTFTSDRSMQNQSGVFIVPQIQILAGCLAQGTLIRMADGSTLPVEDFVADGRESVATAGGGTRRVTASTRGLEPVPCVTLRTASHALMLTEGHAVPTANRGIVAARDLAVGDVVTTEDGDQPLTEVGRQPYDGIVHNLRVGTDEEAAAGESTFFAGGILVGDLSMQQHLAHLELQRRRGAPLEVLPPDWHDEFQRFTSHPEVQAFAAAQTAS